MGSLPILKAAGLQTAHNPFSGVSPGGLSLAKNVCIFSNGVLEPRRGHAPLSYTLSGQTISNTGTFFGTTAVVQSATSLFYDTGSALTAFTGTFEPVDDDLLRMKFAEARELLHFCAADGARVVEGTTVKEAGLPAPRWDSPFGDAGGGPDCQIGYRVTFVRKDSSGGTYESAPSYRAVIPYTVADGFDSTLEIQDESQLVAGTDYVRYYRTDRSSSSSADPGEEMFLFLEQPVVSNGTAPTFGVTAVPTSLGDVPLYSNPRSGSGDANHRPPLSKDMTLWGGSMWFANTTSRHRVFLEILGVGSPDGIQDNDTVTVAGITYTASTTPSDPWEIYTAGTASENIYFTTIELVELINADITQTVTASYLSGPNDPPGKILLEEKAIGGDAFTVYGSRVESWNPQLTTTSVGAVTSDNNRLKNGLFFSKPDEPECVPLLNYLPIGAKNKEILRAVPLREKLFVFKEDGIFTVSGQYPYQVDEFDLKVRLVSPDTAQVLNSQILAFTNQGVVAVSEGGVQILSRPIETELSPYLTRAMQAAVKRPAFAVAHESDRTYELWLPGPGVSDPSLCNRAYVYHVLTQSWTTWEAGEKSWGVTSPNDVRYYGSGAAGQVAKERRDFASTDYADASYSITVNDFDGTALTLASVTNVEVGDCLVFALSDTTQSVVVADVTGSVVTVSEAVLTALEGAVATVEKSFECWVRWLPVAFDRPGSLKRFQYGTFHFGSPSAFTSAYATYETELSPGFSTESLAQTELGWGVNPWGSSPWGDPTRNLNNRHTVPAEKQRAAVLYPGFRIREARAGWKLHGLTLETEETSERTSR